jgi:hypothetical protein
MEPIHSAAALADEAEGLRPEPKTVEIVCNLIRGASGVQIAIGKDSGVLSRRQDPALIKGMVRGYQWRSQLLSGEAGSVAELGPQDPGELSICGATPPWRPAGGRPGRNSSCKPVSACSQ